MRGPALDAPVGRGYDAQRKILPPLYLLVKPTLKSLDSLRCRHIKRFSSIAWEGKPLLIVGTVSGRVTEAATGNPISQAQVSIAGTSLMRSTGGDGLVHNHRGDGGSPHYSGAAFGFFDLCCGKSVSAIRHHDIRIRFLVSPVGYEDLDYRGGAFYAEWQGCTLHTHEAWRPLPAVIATYFSRAALESKGIVREEVLRGESRLRVEDPLFRAWVMLVVPTP
jgi:hypothetical protein